MPAERSRESTGPAPVVCPFCKDSLSDLASTVACAACGARHHAACRAEHGRCASCGAAEELVPVARARALVEEMPPAGSTIVVSRQGDVLTYAWPGGPLLRTIGVFLPVLLFCPVLVLLLGPPVIAAVFRRLLGRRGDYVSLGREGFEVRAASSTGFLSKLRRGTRDELAVTLETDEAPRGLVLRIGGEDLVIPNPVTEDLTVVEQEWLRDRIVAWKKAGEPNAPPGGRGSA